MTISSNSKKCGMEENDISVSVIKKHAVRKHTTEHNHSVVVERHNTDTGVSQFGERGIINRNSNAKQGNGEMILALDSGYQTKQFTSKGLCEGEESNEARNAAGSLANTSADVEGTSPLRSDNFRGELCL